MQNTSGTHRQKRFFFWGDGMAETRLPETSLALARTPNFDALLARGEAGFYRPVIRAGGTLPRTDIVIPYMFGARPEDFSGRAALELVDAGIPLPEGAWVGSFRAVRQEAAGLDRFSSADSAGLLNRLQEWTAAEVHLCPFSSHKNIFALVGDDRARVEREIDALQGHLTGLGIQMADAAVDRFRIPRSPFKDRLAFVGWGCGSLRGSFRLMGRGVNEFVPRRYAYEDYRQDLRHLQRTTLQETINTCDVLVFFIKETDSASHAGDRALKVGGIETLDWVLGEVRPYMPAGSMVTVLADHPTDLNAPTAVNAPAPYLMANISAPAGKTDLHFCEAAIQMDEVLSMAALRKKLFPPGKDRVE
jgi:2,3-bisphosphoglycerate-independent phosphoglycerate mutase